MRRSLPIATLGTFHRAGKKDAEAARPTKEWNGAHTPTERSGVALVEHGVAEINGTFARKLRLRLPLVHALEEKVERLDSRISAARMLQAKARANVRECEERAGDPFLYLPLVGPLLEYIIVAALAIADFPLNASAFTLLPLSQHVLYAVAVSIGALIALAVVVIGRAAKEVTVGRMERRRSVAYLIGVAAGLAALFMGIEGLALLRERFVAQAPTIRSLGVNLTGVGGAFVRIQTCLVVLGILASFCAHNVYASRRRRETFKVLWNGVRIWFLTRRRDRSLILVAIAGARLVLLRDRFAAKVMGLRGLVQYGIEVYRTELVQHHPDAGDPSIGVRSEIVLPSPSLQPVPARWRAESSPQRRNAGGKEIENSKRKSAKATPSANGSGTRRATTSLKRWPS